MRQIILLVVITTFFSCCQNNTKQKELELNEKELLLKEKELQLRIDSLKTNTSRNTTKSVNTSPKIEIKCDGKYQLSGTLLKVVYDGDPCPYAYLKILTEDGKKIDLYIDGRYNSLMVGNTKLFKWSDNKIEDLLNNSTTSDGTQFPNDALEFSLVGQEYLFCCYKQQINCGDDPNSPKQFFCRQVLYKE